MKYKYVTIDTSTEKGIRQAERLKMEGEAVLTDGYPMQMIGIDKIQFSIPVTEAAK